jgi:SNF2 family DNA or RNA helicase
LTKHNDLVTELHQQAEERERKRKQLAQLLGEMETADRKEASTRALLRDERKRVEREEKQAESKQQAIAVLDEVERLKERFRTIAEGKAWFSGNNEVAPALPFQWDGVLFGAGAKRWILGDGMGLGKTRQSIGWLDLVRAKKVLIVCQADICNQFAGEVMELAPHRTVYNLSRKTPKTRHAMMDEIEQESEAIVIVNYEIWRRDNDLLGRFIQWQLDSIIVDEAHNLKNTASANYKYIEMLCKADNQCGKCFGFIRGLYADVKTKARIPKPCPNCGWTVHQETTIRPTFLLDKHLVSKSVKNLCFTTGTPILNSPLDIYALLHLCDPLLFHSQRSFMGSFCIQNYHSGKIEFRDGQLENLKPLIAGRYLARNRTDAGIVLPAQKNHIIRVDIDKEEYPKQYAVIRQLSERAQIMLESGERMTIMHLIALITRKRQANVWPGGIELRDEEGNVIFSVGDEVQESAKFDVSMDYILRIHAEGRRQVVFSQFTTALNEFAVRLEKAGLRVATLTGKTPKNERDEIKRNFFRGANEEPRWDIVLCNYKTGGTGLNLTSATATHILDEEWNPGKRDQAYARTDRIGQTEENDVYVYRIPTSVDTWMSNTIYRKERMVSEFADTMTEETIEVNAESILEAIKNGDIL